MEELQPVRVRDRPDEIRNTPAQLRHDQAWESVFTVGVVHVKITNALGGEVLETAALERATRAATDGGGPTLPTRQHGGPHAGVRRALGQKVFE